MLVQFGAQYRILSNPSAREDFRLLQQLLGMTPSGDRFDVETEELARKKRTTESTVSSWLAQTCQLFGFGLEKLTALHGISTKLSSKASKDDIIYAGYLQGGAFTRIYDPVLGDNQDYSYDNMHHIFTIDKKTGALSLNFEDVGITKYVLANFYSNLSTVGSFWGSERGQRKGKHIWFKPGKAIFQGNQWTLQDKMEFDWGDKLNPKTTRENGWELLHEINPELENQMLMN